MNDVRWKVYVTDIACEGGLGTVTLYIARQMFATRERGVGFEAHQPP